MNVEIMTVLLTPTLQKKRVEKSHMHGSFTDNLSYMRDSTQKIFLFTTRDLSLLVEIHLPNRIVQSTDTPVEFEIHLLNRIV